MTSKAERRKRYPAAWASIRAGILQRAQDACECTGQCGDDHDGRCSAPNHADIWRETDAPAFWKPAEDVGSRYPYEPFVNSGPTRVVLTIAHVDHDEQHNDPANLLALCQRCHFRLDAADNLARRRERRAAEGGQRPLPLLAVMPEHRGGR